MSIASDLLTSATPARLLSWRPRCPTATATRVSGEPAAVALGGALMSLSEHELEAQRALATRSDDILAHERGLGSAVRNDQSALGQWLTSAREADRAALARV